MTGPAEATWSPRWWRGLRVAVTGIRMAGEAMAAVLVDLGARVTVLDAAAGEVQQAAAGRLREAGAEVRLGPAATAELPDRVELVATSPGWRPTAPLLVAAAGRGIPVWGEVEVAWRLRRPDAPPWLAVTGTNGKTTTTGMLAAMLTAAGRRTIACGNIGVPLVPLVAGPAVYDVLAVELSSFQLYWSQSLDPQAGVLTNIEPDHVDWHGSMAAYTRAKAKVFGCGVAVANADDPATVAVLAGAPGRHVTFTLGAPAPDQLGVVDGTLVDRAFGPPGPVELAAAASVRPAGRHNVANALAAAALARAAGVPPAAVQSGLDAYVPAGHRNAPVATVAGVAYVDDSKATNAHAAAASLAGYPRVVWVAGGDAKGAALEPLVAAHASRLAGAVLLGAAREELAAAVRRHAPGIPVIVVDSRDTGAMQIVVRHAAALARPGDTVLLAPAAASIDMFADYAERGELFAAAVRALPGASA